MELCADEQTVALARAETLITCMQFWERAEVSSAVWVKRDIQS